MKIYLLVLSILFASSCEHPAANSMKGGVGQVSISKTLSNTSPVNVSNQEIETVVPSSSKIEIPVKADAENVIEMERKDGVTYVWIEVNGIGLKFIFDTGASSIFISPAEALVLIRQGTLSEDDFIGQEQYQDATGGVSTGSVINLKEVKIGNKTLRNVKASVSDNIESPLLLGQSALEQFGSIEIDNKNDQIILR